MKSTGIVRKVDELGRIVMPRELRRTLDINEGDRIEVFVDGEQIILKKFVDSCVFCGQSAELAKYKEKPVCLACAAELGKVKTNES
ncbi:MAG: AbrB/MazE/SpoVT family DNA-binding domain-containing protein [Sporomusaceae bacterium]|nr:AbrB/MazE/SpoVT family DNA-binding domain-containing protein [Sporomusaceae bacterium]